MVAPFSEQPNSPASFASGNERKGALFKKLYNYSGEVKVKESLRVRQGNPLVGGYFGEPQAMHRYKMGWVFVFFGGKTSRNKEDHQ